MADRAGSRAECERYEAALAEAGGIDLLILGIGANGHIGFNEPGSALVARTHRATLDDRTRAANALWFDGDLSRVPREALTMGMATILARDDRADCDRGSEERRRARDAEGR